MHIHSNKKTVVRVIAILFCFLLGGTCFLSYLWYVESQKLVALQQEYRACLSEVKRCLDKTELQTGMSEDTQEILQGDALVSLFPKGAHVVSSAAKESDRLERYTVNRDLRYLKDSAVLYYKANNLDVDSVHELYDRDVRKITTPAAKKKIIKKKNGRGCSANVLTINAASQEESSTIGAIKKKVFSVGPLREISFG